MNRNRFAFCALMVFVAQAIVAGTLQVIVLDPLFEEQAFFRPEGQEKLVPYFASRVLFVGWQRRSTDDTDEHG